MKSAVRDIANGASRFQGAVAERYTRTAWDRVGAPGLQQSTPLRGSSPLCPIPFISPFTPERTGR